MPDGATARDAQSARLEAVLFLAETPLSSRKLAQFASLADGTRARTLVRRLNELYEQEGSAFRVEEVAGGFQLLTRPQFAAWLRRYQGSTAESRLSSPAMETLAIVAYRQPVMRAQLEAVRGVQSGEMLRQLLERDLVRIVGRSPELGRPFLYGTTRKFLQIFGLRDLQDLPRVEMLRSDKAGENDDVGENDAGRSVEVPEESDVKTAVMQESLEQDELREAGEVVALAEPVAPGADAPSADAPSAVPPSAVPPSAVPPSADADYEDEEFEEDEDDDWDDDDDDEEDDDYDDDYDEDFEDEDWEEVDDEHAFDEDEEEDEDDEDWDEEDDDEWEDEEDEDEDEEEDED